MMAKGPKLDPAQVKRIVRGALREDRAGGDVTTALLRIRSNPVRAKILAISEGILAGVDVARQVFREVDPAVRFSAGRKDGAQLTEGDVIASIRGKAGGILSAERTALNLLQRLSGIATLTGKYVEKVRHTGVTILDTRKTSPLLRELQKYAVRVGGGENHRTNLNDMVLIKENHIRAAGGIDAVLKRLGPGVSRVPVEIEVDSIMMLTRVLGTAVDRLMLDNFSPREVRKALRLIRDYSRSNHAFSPEIEVSGGVTLRNVAQYAIDGVHFISIGSLTHSAPALDMTLEVD